MPHYTKFSLRVLIFFVVLLPVLSSCGGGGKLGGTNKSYEIGEYHRAIAQFNNAYKREKNRYTKGELAFYLGDCYQHINNPRKAAGFFSKSVRYKYEEAPVLLYMADAYLASGKYNEALAAYTEYLGKNTLDVRARNGVASCKMAMSDTLVTRYEIEKVKALSNTRASDFSPGYGSTDYDMVYFSSMRTEKKARKRSNITGQGGSNIYMVKVDAKGKWTEAEKLDETINTEFDEGASTLSSDGKELYFTRCKYDNEKPNSSSIYKAGRSGGRWTQPQEIVVGDTVMAAHPALSNDGKTLYFVSDMPGGIGGLDIWKVEGSGDGTWGQPINMGNVINTPGDEMFPYVRADGTLYFSSDAQVGYGGLDIYKVGKDKNGKIRVINLGKPINSEADDFGIVFKGKAEEGLFSSSRGSSKGIDNIWSFILPKLEFSMKGEVSNQNDGSKVSDAYMRLIGTDGTNAKISIREDGTFASKLEPNNDYVFMVAAKGYFNKKEKFSTLELNANKVFDFKVELMPMADAIVLKNIYFEEGKTLLNNESKVELDRLVEILETNASVQLEIGSHTCNEGDETSSIILSQKRAQVVLDYMVGKGIPTQRLTAKGYGDTTPFVVDRNTAGAYDFLRKGDVLTKEYLGKLKGGNLKKATNINRRIEFKIKK